MTNHSVLLYWSDEDEVFIADALELPGCMAHGDSREEALRSIEEAMELWISVSREHGDPVPEPTGRRPIA
jgi:predicted RNase H-like HicB family nuclease